MEACKPLEKYAWLVDEIRKNQNNGMSLDDAVGRAVDKMPESFIIKPFIIANRAEIDGVYGV